MFRLAHAWNFFPKLREASRRMIKKFDRWKINWNEKKYSGSGETRIFCIKDFIDFYSFIRGSFVILNGNFSEWARAREIVLVNKKRDPESGKLQTCSNSSCVF